MKIKFLIISFFIFCKIFSTDLEIKINQEIPTLLIIGDVEIVEGVLFDELPEAEKLKYNKYPGFIEDKLLVKIKYSNIIVTLHDKPCSHKKVHFCSEYTGKELKNFDCSKFLTDQYLSIYRFFKFFCICNDFYFEKNQFIITKFLDSVEIDGIRYRVHINLSAKEYDPYNHKIDEIAHIVQKYRKEILYLHLGDGYLFREPSNCCDYTCCCLTLCMCPSCPCKKQCIIS